MESSTIGLTSIVYPWIQKISVSGNINNKNIMPISYKINDYRGADKKGHIYINYENKIPIIISSEPDALNDSRRQNVSNTLKINSFDPVTSIIVLSILSSKNNCNTIIPVFDGRRRFDLEYRNIEKNDDMLLCNLNIKRIAGYSDKELKKHPKEGEIKLSLLDKHKSLFFPTEVKIPLTIGSFLVKLNANLIME